MCCWGWVGSFQEEDEHHQFRDFMLWFWTEHYGKIGIKPGCLDLIVSLPLDVIVLGMSCRNMTVQVGLPYTNPALFKLHPQILQEFPMLELATLVTVEVNIFFTDYSVRFYIQFNLIVHRELK